MNLTVGRAKQREREAHTYPHVLTCGVDGCSEVGRGKTEKAAIIGLAVHRRFHHGVVGNHKTACSAPSTTRYSMQWANISKPAG